MSKKFRNKLCAYCLKHPSIAAGDHVFAREFFTEDKRGNIPKVPACDRCNNEKSRLEHHLTTVLPFGGRHDDALANLECMVPDRLAKNMRLHRELMQGRKPALLQESSAQVLPSLTIPFDGAILERLFHFIVRGLAFYHWCVLIGDQHGARVMTLTPTGQKAFSVFLAMGAKQQVNVDVGGGTFRYEGIQCDVAELTVWRFSIYGGLILAGDPEAPGEIASGIGAVTASREFLARPAMIKVFGSVESANLAG